MTWDNLGPNVPKPAQLPDLAEAKRHVAEARAANDARLHPEDPLPNPRTSWGTRALARFRAVFLGR